MLLSCLADGKEGFGTRFDSWYCKDLWSENLLRERFFSQSRSLSQCPDFPTYKAGAMDLCLHDPAQ